MTNYRAPYPNELMHYGVLGMKWGVRRYQNADGTLTEAGKKHYSSSSEFKTPEELQTYLSKNVRYSDFSGLKSPDDVIKSGKGDCHSQSMFEMKELSKQGYKPKASFFIEYDPKTNQGGQTHTFVYFQKSGKTYWLENAWTSQKGLHEYKNVSEMFKDVEKKHRSEQSPDRKKFTNLEFGEFIPSEHSVGESLQELVDICLK